MAAPNTRRTLIGCMLALALVPPLQIAAQEGEFVYIANVTGT